MKDIIEIKTELVKISELEGREKKIYEAGYNNGNDDAISENRKNAILIILSLAILGLVAYLVINLFQHELPK